MNGGKDPRQDPLKTPVHVELAEVGTRAPLGRQGELQPVSALSRIMAY